jgi:hypothetical protein
MSFSDSLWNTPIADLNDNLRAAGVEPARQDGAQLVSDLSVELRTALACSLRERICLARRDTPPVERWMVASQELYLNDDASETARQREEAFWQNLTCIVHGCLALVMLGDLAELTFFVELLRHEPAGHLVEMATDVLRHYVDPTGVLEGPQLLRRAEEWLRATDEP